MSDETNPHLASLLATIIRQTPAQVTVAREYWARRATLSENSYVNRLAASLRDACDAELERRAALAPPDSKHTAGPWKVTRKFSVGPVSQTDDQSSGMVLPLADVFGDNQAADARLIAASPLMLEALEAAETMLAVLPDTTTNWLGKRPTMTTKLALELVRATIRAAAPTTGGDK